MRPSSAPAGDGERDAFDREMQAPATTSSAAKATLDFRGKRYGFNGGSRLDLIGRRFLPTRRRGANITTSLLITDVDDPPADEVRVGHNRSLGPLVGNLELRLDRIRAPEDPRDHAPLYVWTSPLNAYRVIVGSGGSIPKKTDIDPISGSTRLRLASCQNNCLSSSSLSGCSAATSRAWEKSSGR